MVDFARSSLPALMLICTAVFTAPLFADDPSDASENESSATLSPEQEAASIRSGCDREVIVRLVNKPLYEFTEGEVDCYLKFLHAAEPDLRKRVVHLARKNIGQPYEIFLLGELPFEPYDPQPIYCLSKSDCVVFSEHTYAMALGVNWPRFMSLLQRIRYRDGQIGVATRNHYTEADWNVSNRWLVQDITADVAGDTAIEFQQRIDRAAHLKKTFGVDSEIAVEQHRDIYLPFEHIDRIASQLGDGDFVNLVRGRVGDKASINNVFGGSAWVGHVGLVARGEGGAVNIIHSKQPAVLEESFESLISRETQDLAERDANGDARLLGFKFLRLRDDPWKQLYELDGPDAPRVRLPTGGQLQF